MPHDYKNLKIIISTHEYFKGSGQELKEFLIRKKSKKLLYVAHKLFLASPNISYAETYENGEISKKESSSELPKMQWLLYLRDAFYNLYYVLTSKGKYDYYIGINSFNAIFGLLFRFLGKVDKVVFFTIDYVMEDRFENKLLNKLYTRMDRIAFWNSDFTWNVSDRMSNQRIKELGPEAKTKKQIVVPIGVPEEAQKVQATKKKNVLVYSGELAPKYGLEIILESAPKIIEQIPDLEIRIIGDGRLKEKLVNLSKDLNIESNVNFMGYINTTTERIRWLKLLKESTLGIATYEEDKKSFKQFSDVTKPKDYMACGLPVITTGLIPLSEDIKKYNLGRVIEDNTESFVENILELLQNPAEVKTIEANIEKYCKDMTWENIFLKSFSEMETE